MMRRVDLGDGLLGAMAGDISSAIPFSSMADDRAFEIVETHQPEALVIGQPAIRGGLRSGVDSANDASARRSVGAPRVRVSLNGSEEGKSFNCQVECKIATVPWKCFASRGMALIERATNFSRPRFLGT
jgi:hypothetical protein